MSDPQKATASEAVICVRDFHDSPLSGVANFNGVPHAFESQFDYETSEWSFPPLFHLKPINQQQVDLCVETSDIHDRWWVAFRRGDVENVPLKVLDADLPRMQELKPSVDALFAIEPESCVRAIGHIEYVVSETRYVVRWPAAQ